MHIYGELKAGMKFKYLGKTVASANGQVQTDEILTLDEAPWLSIRHGGILFRFTKTGADGRRLEFVERSTGARFNNMFIPV